MFGRFACGFVLSVLLVLGTSCDGGEDAGGRTARIATATVPSTTASPASVRTAGDAITIDQPKGGAVRLPVKMSGTAGGTGDIVVEATIAGQPRAICARHERAGSASGDEDSWKASLAFVPPEGFAGHVSLRAYVLGVDGTAQGAVTRDVTLEDFTPPIVVTSPLCGEQVTGSVTVSGLSTYFAMPISLDLRDTDGNVVKTERVIPERRSALLRGVEMAPWEFTLDLQGLAPGFYDVTPYIRNHEDGTRQDEFPVQIAVR